MSEVTMTSSRESIATASLRVDLDRQITHMITRKTYMT